MPYFSVIKSWHGYIFSHLNMGWMVWECFCQVWKSWQFEQTSDFSVGNNLFGQLSDITDQQSCFYSDGIPEALL